MWRLLPRLGLYLIAAVLLLMSGAMLYAGFSHEGSLDLGTGAGHAAGWGATLIVALIFAAPAILSLVIATGLGRKRIIWLHAAIVYYLAAGCASFLAPRIFHQAVMVVFPGVAPISYADYVAAEPVAMMRETFSRVAIGASLVMIVLLLIELVGRKKKAPCDEAQPS